MEKMLETDVLIVGGGPVGLALAAEFGQQGRRALVIERDDRLGNAPRAKTTNVRSRELFRRWGIAEALATASPFAADYPAEVVLATRMTGHEIARFSNAFLHLVSAMIATQSTRNGSLSTSSRAWADHSATTCNVDAAPHGTGGPSAPTLGVAARVFF